MSRYKKILAGKALLILLTAGVLGYVDATTELKLGLDLKGGTQLDYSLDLSEVEEVNQDEIIEGVQEVIRKRVDSLGVAEPNIYVSSIAEENHIIVELAGINDIQEAKDTVGKTIQLEFREQNEEPNDEKVAWAEESSQQFYNDWLTGGDFIELSVAAQDAYGSDINWAEIELQDINSYSQEIQELVANNKEVGRILGPIDVNEGYIFVDGQLIENRGKAVIQIVDQGSEDIETKVEEEVSTRHILIAYEGAERSEATRTQEEAATLANEVLSRIQNGESLSSLTTEFSDDQGSAQTEGDLGSLKRESPITPNVLDAAFNLEVGSVSEVVESEFGYHIVEVYDRIEESIISESIEILAINQIIFNTAPDAWKEEAALTGEHFRHADVAFDHTYQPIVSITFTNEGAQLFEELTEKNINKPIAIFVGGELISAPNVNQVITGGQATITGSFSIEEAQDLARDLNTGAIPAPIELVGQYTISATLGAEALDQSVFAGIIGLIVLALYMLLVYRLPGFIATVALAIYSVIMLFFIKVALPTGISLLLAFALFIYLVHAILTNRDSGGEKLVSLLLACVVFLFMTFVLSAPITLTLAGVAGVVLSIGMAVDANVLIFERMKEELRAGQPLKEAIDTGFRRAWDSIRDSNFSSLITCAILFYFGSSIIRGFALNLALGILISMFSAITLTYGFLKLSAETKLAENLFLFGKPRHKEISGLQIIKNSSSWAIISGTLLTASIVLIALFGLNFGLDFTGGTLMEVQLGSEDANTELVNESITSVDEELEAEFGTASIVETGNNSFIIRLKHLNETEHDAILAELEAEFGSVEEIRFSTVGPTIGNALKQKAMTALAITLVMIVFYIAFAFRKIPKEVSPWRFGFCAIAALVHDILIVLGVFVLLGQTFGVEIDALFITALLTIMGFSVHDTIVVFDRVRENLKYRKSGETLEVSANKALNQTMARSLNTSISTLITIVALLIFGAESIKMFVLALAIGIVAGTYSSIFVASPLLVWWNGRSNK